MKKLSHINDKGEANMVDINNKKESKREATATGSIMAAKKTSDLIPLCHPIPVEAIKIDFDIEDNNINVLAIVSTSSKTGVEMEALMAVNIACLTIYDMIKSIDKHAKINSVKLISKSGGKSGDWKRK